MEEDLIKILEDLKNVKEKLGINSHEDMLIETTSFHSRKTAQNVFKNLKNNNLEGAFNEEIRSYEDALSKCLEAGATANDEFMHDFTANYISTLLGVFSNLLITKKVFGDKESVDFIKSKIKDCLKYMDRL